MIKKMDNTRTS